MNPFRRPGGFFEIAPYSEIFDGSPLGQERSRLWKTYLHEGRGFLEVLHLWAEYPAFRALVEQTSLPNRLQSISGAWRIWAAQTPTEASAFINAQSSHVWSTLEATAKTTFLALTHATASIGLLPEVQTMTQIRGNLMGSGAPFRMYCLLDTGAPTAIQKVFGKSSKIWNYFYEPNHPICYRQSHAAPALEISTREQSTTHKRQGGTLRGWEADLLIDYRDAAFSHISPDNFDITALSGSHGHYDLHAHRFGGPIPGLIQFRPLLGLTQPSVGVTEEEFNTFNDSGLNTLPEAIQEREPPPMMTTLPLRDQSEPPTDILDIIE